MVANLWSFCVEYLGTRGLEELLIIDLRLRLPHSAQLLIGLAATLSQGRLEEALLIGTDFAFPSSIPQPAIHCL